MPNFAKSYLFDYDYLIVVLARHSDINLTMNRYTHILLETQSDALKGLPELNGAVREAEQEIEAG